LLEGNGCFGGSSGIGKCIVDLAITNDVKVYSFSRTQNNIDISQLEAVKRR
jgi:2-C-methyl-D-erythritol 4-phosphate cytidylyltransferase